MRGEGKGGWVRGEGKGRVCDEGRLTALQGQRGEKGGEKMEGRRGREVR